MTTPWIQAYSGRVFPLEPFDINAIHIEDIAHALSMLCRFNGHCRKFYSVAEHSVHVSHEIAPRLALLGLMHDAAEAYLGDVPTPMKNRLPAFSEAEDHLMELVSHTFGFDLPSSGSDDKLELKRADMQLLADEKEMLTRQEPKPWPGLPAAHKVERIKSWSPAEAKQQFLARFGDLST